jgi:hypothetical protein
MNPTDAVIWIFLVIFGLTALITLCSLVGWVPIKPAYEKSLFKLLILQVIGCVVGFGAWAFRSARTPNADLETLLLSSHYGWDWQYAQAHWRARFYFTPAGNGKINMTGETSLVDSNGQEQTIMNWESKEPFNVPAKAQTVTFKAQRVWNEAAAKAYPDLRWEAGKKVDIEITLHPEMGLEGSSRDNSAAKPWGMMMTPAYP